MIFIKFIITLLFLLSFSFTQSTVNITSDTSNITDFKLDYFIDKREKIDLQEVKSQKFTQGKNIVLYFLPFNFDV